MWSGGRRVKQDRGHFRQGVVIRVLTSVGGVDGGRAREPAEGVGVAVLRAGTVKNGDVVLLQDHGPAGVLPTDVLGLEHEGKGAMVGDDGEGAAVEKGVQGADPPDNSQRLALGGLVTRFMTVEGTGDASDHVLDVVNRVDLSEDGTDATLAPVAVDCDGEVRLKAA